MSNYIGTDIIEIPRIKRAIDCWKETFLHRVFTQKELKLCQQKCSSLAARFAAKEAVFKVLSARNQGIAWKDIEILAETNGKPRVYLHGRAQRLAALLDLENIAISLTHSREYAIAFAVGEKRGR